MGDTLLPVLNQIIMLFLIAAVGLLMRKLRVLTDAVIKGMNNFIMLVTWPCMALMAMQKEHTPETMSGFVTVMVVSIISMGVASLISWLVFRNVKDEKKKPVLIAIASLPNAGYIGMPIANALYGDVGVLYMAAFLVGFNLIVWTISASMFTGFGVKTLKGFLSPGFIGIVVGVVIFMFDIKLPSPVNGAINNLGVMNTPLAMLLLGSRMDMVKLADFADRKVWAATALKLVVIPMIMFAGLKFYGYTGILLTLPVLLTAMPAASASQMLAEKHDADAAFAAKGVTVSTILCLITLPLLAAFCV